jgi:lipopolysaccharide biosynthesis glycosyltransferase
LFSILIRTISRRSIVQEKIINEPILPANNKEYIVKKFHISNYSLDHPRYHFQDKFTKRKLFKINYSYYPYLKISDNFSYEYNAMEIYQLTGMLNITKLEMYYYNNESEIDILNLNHIHISMAFDNNYSDLALISIVSVLNSSSNDTYIHYHILGLNFGFNEIKKIIDLRKINNKVEFIFYNAKQVEYDFQQSKNERRGAGNFARFLSPQIINNTNKVLFLDSGDIIAQKDLSEVYFYDLKDNYFGWILEICAGYYLEYKDKFATNNFHPQGGVILINVRLYRQDELYKKAVFVSRSYYSFENPCQDILETIANYKFVFIPLNFNINLHYDRDEDMLKKANVTGMKTWFKIQRFSPYKYELHEFIDAMLDPVISHYYIGKMQEEKRCIKPVLQWLKFVKLTGKYESLKKKFPHPFKCENLI